jgi:hypothetical protein
MFQTLLHVFACLGLGLEEGTVVAYVAGDVTRRALRFLSPMLPELVDGLVGPRRPMVMMEALNPRRSLRPWYSHHLRDER